MSLRPFRKWFTSGDKLDIQPTRTLLTFSESKAHSHDPPENASDGSFTISIRTCYTLHGMLVVIHILLAISYISHWEHRVTLAFTATNDDFWSVVLSASLQAFYTIYTAVLLFLTQRLAISRTLVRHLKLTSIHDISGAWSGLGSALSSVWQQIDIPASWWTTSAVATYLACLSVLHVTSSTLLQFQTFNSTISTFVPIALGWRDDLFLHSAAASWSPITSSLPVVSQFPGLIFAGLSNATIYDVPKTSSMVGNATVNATTIFSHCRLLPNVTYSVNTSTVTVPFSNGPNEEYGLVLLNATRPWSDQIQVIPFFTAAADVSVEQLGVFLMVSTLLDIEASVQTEVSVPIIWEYEDIFNALGNKNLPIPSVIEVYFVQCSFSSMTTKMMVDMQTNSLQDPMSISQPSTQWEMYQWPSEGAIWQTELGEDMAVSVNGWFEFTEWTTGYISKPSIMDEYIMSLVGLNLTVQMNQSLWGPPISTFILTPDKLEAAIVQAAAQMIWIGRDYLRSITPGQLGASNGGVDIGDGMADAVQEIIALRLNVNLLPLFFAASASVIMLNLAIYMTRGFHATQAVIPNTGALQLLWLGHHSAPVHEVVEHVEHPTDANLRRAGMIDVCFANTISDKEDKLSMRNSTDSL
ncbi:hypothetical protein AZE42_07743 [Rhizopogon vesiculosus]|uniref:Uncharacterized protein n=1 Tax=Rhizopogon vesiculosus TaxID=180088 RepID=A0A1J8QLE4_9AGAM|nr:hypothetical protein AZE42_07743 [Rhizopogon vesiculosus]